jgi:hypothetical protein
MTGRPAAPFVPAAPVPEVAVVPAVPVADEPVGVPASIPGIIELGLLLAAQPTPASATNVRRRRVDASRAALIA